MRPIAMTTEDVQRNVSSFRAQLEKFLLPDLVPQLQRLLAVGEPVAVERLADAGGWRVGEVQAELARHAGTDWDDHGRIAGFGLTLRPTPHTFTFDGRTVFGFCASDALTFPVILGRSGVVESTCPVTGQRIRIDVTPSSVVHVEPPDAVVSKVRPNEAVADIRSEICALGHFFSSPEVATDWLAHYSQGKVDPIADDFEIHRQTMIELGWAAPSTSGA